MTPDAPPFGADPASWRLWWHFERHAFLERPQRLLERASRTGSDDFFLGHGEQQAAPKTLQPAAADIHAIVLPALRSALVEDPREILATRALISLARLQIPEATPAFVELSRRALESASTTEVEGALIALGLHGQRVDLDLLLETLQEEPRARVRAFGAFGVGFAAAQAPLPDRVGALTSLFLALGDARAEVQAAAIQAIGQVALPHAPPGTTYSRDEQLAGLLAYLRETPDAAQEGRAHTPVALARLAAIVDDPYGIASGGVTDGRMGEIATSLLELVALRSGEPNEVRRGAVLGLTQLDLPDGHELRPHVLERLRALATGGTRDRLERHLALLGVGRMARGEELEFARPWLIERLEDGRTQERCFAALGLAIAERRSGAPASASLAALRAALSDASGPEEAGACCVALGLAGDGAAVPALLEILAESRDDEVRGFAGLALGLIGDLRAQAPLCDALATTLGKPSNLRRTATALALLGDAELSSDLSGRLVAENGEETLGALAAALGWIGDPRPLPVLSAHLADPEAGARGRAWCAVALGRLCDPGSPSWSAAYAIGANYSANGSGTLTDPYLASGLLDLP